jgi:hypothetical protein
MKAIVANVTFVTFNNKECMISTMPQLEELD